MELHGTGVGVTTVCPGIINTDIVRHPGQNAASVWDEQLARLQRYYRDHGATPDVVAASIVEGVRDGRELILVGPKARSSYHLKRFSRSLLQRLTRANSKQVGFC